MAKKTKSEKPQAMPEVTNEINEVPVAVEPVVKEREPRIKHKVNKDGWVVKDRVYELIGQRPLMKAIRTHSIYYFDEQKGFERELKHTSNQRSCFVDEFPENSRQVLEHIVFRNGVLAVPKNKVTLQKLLSLYHPDRNKVWYEVNKEKEAEVQTVDIDLQLDAMNLARELDIDAAEAILRAEKGSKVSSLTSKELKRDILLFARENASLFLELASDDNVYLRNTGIKAVEANIIKMSPDKRTFYWASNDRKLMTVPFDEHPYSALASWFKTDEGLEVFNNIEKRLN